MGGGYTGNRVSYAGGGSSYNSSIGDYSQDSEEKKKVFLSFAMEDHAKVGLFRHQAKDDRYDIEFKDTSLKEPVKGKDWKPVVENKIRNSDAMICMVGEDTHESNAVSWEVKTAQKYGVPVIPVKVTKDKVNLPKPLKKEGNRPVQWKLDKIQNKIDQETKDE